MLTELKLMPKHLRGYSGVYGIGENDTSIFVTNGGRVLKLGYISEEDLMAAYEWGRLEAEEDSKSTEAAEENKKQPADHSVEDYYGDGPAADDYSGVYADYEDYL